MIYSQVMSKCMSPIDGKELQLTALLGNRWALHPPTT
jgi:hypothetical protein